MCNLFEKSKSQKNVQEGCTMFPFRLPGDASSNSSWLTAPMSGLDRLRKGQTWQQTGLLERKLQDLEV